MNLRPLEPLSWYKPRDTVACGIEQEVRVGEERGPLGGKGAVEIVGREITGVRRERKKVIKGSEKEK